MQHQIAAKDKWQSGIVSESLQCYNRNVIATVLIRSDLHTTIHPMGLNMFCSIGEV